MGIFLFLFFEILVLFFHFFYYNWFCLDCHFLLLLCTMHGGLLWVGGVPIKHCAFCYFFICSLFFPSLLYFIIWSLVVVESWWSDAFTIGKSVIFFIFNLFWDVGTRFFCVCVQWRHQYFNLEFHVNYSNPSLGGLGLGMGIFIFYR